MDVYVALLRGINVGGKNLIKMTDLAACFEDLGFSRVRTYIQSGNVIFAANETDKTGLAARLERALSETFQYAASLVLRSEAEMQSIIANAPEGFGAEPDVYRYDVLFLKEPLTAAEAMQFVSDKPGVDHTVSGDGVLYHARLIARASQSRLPRLVSLPVYQSMTIRNWNTTTRLAALMQSARTEAN